jgi:hypothetical protein
MPYDLPGPQVEPAASWWPGVSVLRTLDLRTVHDLVVPQHPATPARLDQEIEFLDVLAQPGHRTDPGLLDPAKLAQQAVPAPAAVGLQVRPLSFFLTAALRPYQPRDAVYARSAASTDDVVRNGLELGRYFLSETPGLAHRTALTYLLHRRALDDPTSVWSPPRQALVHAALDTAIASALQAAWYVKWLSGRSRTARRPRPVEWTGSSTLSDVLADHAFDPDHPELPPVAPPSAAPGHPAAPGVHLGAQHLCRGGQHGPRALLPRARPGLRRPRGQHRHGAALGRRALAVGPRRRRGARGAGGLRRAPADRRHPARAGPPHRDPDPAGAARRAGRCPLTGRPSRTDQS